MNTHTNDLRLLLLDSIWLEPEQIDQAKAMSHQAVGEAQQWQAYLNSLGLLGFEQWLHERLPDHSVHQDTTAIGMTAHLQVGDFRVCLVATEHVLDEVIPIPEAAIAQPERASHFYVALEVNEEQEEVIIRGVLRYDQLTQYLAQTHLPLDEAGCYAFPLSWFDAEPNHLLHYCRLLDPTAIALPAASAEPSVSMSDVSMPRIEAQVLSSLRKTRTKLSQWIQGAFDETWQAIDALISPEAALALSTRTVIGNTKRGKVIDLGMQMANHKVAMLITITPETEDKLGILVQLHPTGEATTLPAHLKLRLLSKLGKVLQEVESRNYDNYIQLKAFKGEAGKQFSIEVILDEMSVKEDFEL